MKQPKAPTLAELLAELEASSPADPDGKTIGEWAVAWKVGPSRARALIHLAIQSGRMNTNPTFRPDIGRPGRRVQVWLHSFISRKRTTKPSSKAR